MWSRRQFLAQGAAAALALSARVGADEPRADKAAEPLLNPKCKKAIDAGLAGLRAAGVTEGREVADGMKYLVNNRPKRVGRQADMHYFYGHFYAMQVMRAAGGDAWKEWYPAVRDELVTHQTDDGSWSDLLCTHYGTAMACIVLQVPRNYANLVSP